MKRIVILTTLALCAPLAFAQSQQPQYGQGGSPRCDQLSGTQKDECLKAEGAKTEPKALPERSAGAGASSAPQDAPQAARCDQMTGAQRQQCLNDEGAKTDSTK
jgi:hypothetical protein